MVTVFACYERNNCNTPFQADRIGYEVAMERVANAPAQAHSEAAGPSETEPVVSDTAARPAMRTPLHLSKQGSPVTNW